jgi:hypothetical protein
MFAVKEGIPLGKPLVLKANRIDAASRRFSGQPEHIDCFTISGVAVDNDRTANGLFDTPRRVQHLSKSNNALVHQPKRIRYGEAADPDRVETLFHGNPGGDGVMCSSQERKTLSSEQTRSTRRRSVSYEHHLCAFPSRKIQCAQTISMEARDRDKLDQNIGVLAHVGVRIRLCLQVAFKIV